MFVIILYINMLLKFRIFLDQLSYFTLLYVHVYINPEIVLQYMLCWNSKTHHCQSGVRLKLQLKIRRSFPGEYDKLTVKKPFFYSPGGIHAVPVLILAIFIIKIQPNLSRAACKGRGAITFPRIAVLKAGGKIF